jgi:hypothetical protein
MHIVIPVNTLIVPLVMYRLVVIFNNIRIVIETKSRNKGIRLINHIMYNAVYYNILQYLKCVIIL